MDIDIKDVGDLGKLVTEFKTLQNNLTKASVDVQKLADWNNTLETMPEEIYGVMQAWLNGEDYLDVMQHESRQKPDFTKDFGANSQEVMLNYYHPGKFSKEDYQDEEMQDKISLAMDSAKKLFEKDKKDYRTYRDQVADKANQKTQALQTSIDTTLNALKKDVPYIRDNHKKRIEDVINLGPRGVMSLFINDDGTFKPEAAKLVSLAVYGEDAINFHKNRAAKDGETKATEELLQRGTGDKSKRLTPEKVADTREEFAEKEISRIVPDMGGRTPFSRKYTGPPEKKK